VLWGCAWDSKDTLSQRAGGISDGIASVACGGMGRVIATGWYDRGCIGLTTNGIAVSLLNSLTNFKKLLTMILHRSVLVITHFLISLDK